MYFVIVLCALLAVASFFTSLATEARERRDQAARLLHTRLVAMRGEIDPVELDTTRILIGRDKLRNDICLGKLDDARAISRVHARLWWAGDCFRIRPVHKKYRGKWSRPVVRVNGDPAPVDGGLPVHYGDVIEIHGHRFFLENTAPDGSMPYLDDIISYGPQTGKKKKPRIRFSRAGGSGSKPAAAHFRIPLINRKSAAPRRPRRKGLILGGTALFLAACLVISAVVWVRRPAAGDTVGERKSGTATVLVCGADKEGIRTDTMILCYIGGEEGRIGMLSLPRDSLTTTDSGDDVRLNSIYARNGRGEQGMEALMDHVKRIIGYRPDGYVLVEMDMLPEIVDKMGGVTTTLKKDIHIPSDNGEIYIPAGERHLDGIQTLAALRYREGYINADLGRVQVQRSIIADCMSQWVTLENVPKFFDVVETVRARTLTDLTDGNMAWIAMTVLMNKSTAEFESDTIPVHDVKRNGASYLLIDGGKLVDLVNESYNPYADLEISEEDLILTD